MLSESLLDSFLKSLEGRTYTVSDDRFPYTIKSSPSETVITVKMPGYSKEDVFVSVSENKDLLINTNDNEHYYKFELIDCDVDNISVTVKNGILAATIPKIKKQVKQIQIS